MAALAQLKAVLGMDSKEFETNIRKSEKAAKRFQSEISTVGRTLAAAFSVTAIISMTKNVIAFASEIRHTADNIGVTTDELQGLNDVGMQFGLTTENMRDRLSKLVVVQGRAAEGNAAYNSALKQLNINLDDFINASPAEAFEMLAHGVADATDNQTALNAMSKIYSEENAPRLIAMLKEIADVGLQGIIDKSKEAGRSMNEDLITKLEKLGTLNERVALSVKVAWAQVVGGFGQFGQTIGAFLGNVEGQMNNMETGWARMKRIITGKGGGALGMMMDVDWGAAVQAGADATATPLDPEGTQAPGRKAKRKAGADPFADFDDDGGSSSSALADEIRATQKDAADFFNAQKKAAAIRKRGAQSIANVRDREFSGGGTGGVVSGMQGVGGSVGSSRALSIADRTLRLQIEGARRQEEIKRINVEMKEALDAIEAKTPGAGLP